MTFVPARSIIVSCQAGPDNPLHGPEPMADRKSVV